MSKALGAHPAVFLIAAVVCSPAAADTAAWTFSTPGDYVLSDSTKIEIAGGVARLVPIDQTDDDSTSAGFGGGSHNQTQWDEPNGWLELASSATSGEFTSRVLDAGADAAWEAISWTPRRPCLKELPGDKGVESGYAAGNADMTGNVFLAHLNESPAVHGGTVADSSGESNDGTLYTGEGASGKSTTGKLAGAVTFDGADDYVEVPDAASLDISDEITVEAWIDPAAGGGDVGEISSTTLGSYEFDAAVGRNPEIIHVFGDIHAIAYSGDGSDGWLFTTQIADDGSIGSSKIDSLEFDDRRGLYPDIIQVSGDVYAIAYSGRGADGWLKTVSIAGDGTIGDSEIDSYEFDAARCIEPSIVHVSGDIYAIAYSGRGADGWLVTVQMASNGTIGGSSIDSLEFDTARGNDPELIHISGDVYAIAYSGSGADGWLATVQVEANGNIGNSTIDDLEFDTGRGTDPDIIHVAGETYAIAYSGPGADGWVATVQIADNGTIGSGTLDTAEFDPTDATIPDIFHVSRDIYGIAYGGPGDDGWIITGHIAGDGTIGPATDSYEYETDRATEPCVTRVSGDVYAIAYSGQGYDGFLSTGEILTDRGIVKAGAYGIDADVASASACINGQTVSASISSGWIHVALVYDKDAASDQLKLYVNGAAADSGSLTDTIVSNSSPLLIGKRLSGVIDEVAVLNRAISASEVADHYKRGALRLKYQVRSGSSDPPAGPFAGPDGTAATYYTELSNPTTGLPSVSLTNVADNRYFQYRAYLESDDASYSPRLESVSFGPVHYPGDNPTVQNAEGQEFVSLVSFAETLGAGGSGSVRYQISNDGAGWHYWDGSAWVPASGYSQTNTAAEVSANCGQFENDVGAGDFFFKAFLHSDSAAQQVELDQVDLSFVAVIISVAVDKSAFAFGTRALDTWLMPDSTVVTNDGTVAEDFLGRISRFTEGVLTWGISDSANGDDVIRAQWSVSGPAGPWNDISTYNTDFVIETNVADSNSVTLWFRIMTPTSTSSFNQYSSTLTVTAQES